MCLYILVYTESHPDRERTLLGAFTSEEKAEKAQAEHMEREKRCLPRARISDFNYTIAECKIDQPAWERI